MMSRHEPHAYVFAYHEGFRVSLNTRRRRHSQPTHRFALPPLPQRIINTPYSNHFESSIWTTSNLIITVTAAPTALP